MTDSLPIYVKSIVERAPKTKENCSEPVITVLLPTLPPENYWLIDYNRDQVCTLRS